MRDGQCNVKGIVFFGTPFQWSGQTDDTSYARLAEMLGGDASLIDSLKSKPKALATIIQKFKKLRTKHNIDILIYESQPYYQPQHEPLLHFGVSYYQVTPFPFRISKTEFFPRELRLSPQMAPLTTGSRLSHSILTMWT